MFSYRSIYDKRFAHEINKIPNNFIGEEVLLMGCISIFKILQDYIIERLWWNTPLGRDLSPDAKNVSSGIICDIGWPNAISR